MRDMKENKDIIESVFYEISVMNFYHYREERRFYVLERTGEVLTETVHYTRTEPWWCNHDDNCKSETTSFYFLANKPAKIKILTEYHRNDNPKVDKEELHYYSWNGRRLRFHREIRCDCCGKFKKEHLVVDRCYYCGESENDVVCLKCAGWKRIKFPENTYYVQVCDSCLINEEN